MPQAFPTIRPPKQRLLIFARVPELGAVKTRLASTVGAERALRAYEAMLRDVLARIGPSDEETAIEILWAPSPDMTGERLRKAFPRHSLAMQTGATLGDRLSMAFSERFFFHRTQKIVAIGTDDPSLTRETIDHAFALLDSCEWVLGPATDGGYYLLGSRAQTFDPDIFAGIDWSTSTVLADTIGKIRSWEHPVALLPERTDVDTEEDLRALLRRGDLTGELASVVREWGWATSEH